MILSLPLTATVTVESTHFIRLVSYLIYVSMRHYVLTTSGDIVVCFHTAVCFELLIC